jgi:transposase
MTDGSIRDEIFDTRHVSVLRTYIERWPRKSGAPEKVLIVVVESDGEARNHCPKCGTRGVPVETGVRRWRTLDVHGKKCFLESALPRIECPEHGKITASLPWARHDDHFSMPFEDHAGWLAAQVPWTKASAELRITWEALANIVTRVTADAAALLDRLDGLDAFHVVKWAGERLDELRRRLAFDHGRFRLRRLVSRFALLAD